VNRADIQAALGFPKGIIWVTEPDIMGADALGP